MKAEDLMIGDWVKLNDSNYQVQVIKKNGVIKLYEMTQYGEHEIQLNTDFIEDFIEPVPLTEEILKKNGFKFNGLAYIGKWFDVTRNFYDKDAWDCGKFYTSGKGDPGFTDFCTIKYVHEFRHALKLCGIEKEIVL